MNELHPIRATLAVSSWIAVLVFIGVGIPIPDGLWVMAAAVSGFYLATAKD